MIGKSRTIYLQRWLCESSSIRVLGCEAGYISLDFLDKLFKLACKVCFTEYNNDPNLNEEEMAMRKNASSILSIFIIAILLGCASNRPFWGNAESGYIMTYRLPTTSPIRYESKTQQHITMEMAGNPIEVDLEYTLQYSIIHSQSKEDGNSILTITIEGMEGSIGGFQGLTEIAAEPLIGKSFDIEITPIGKIIEFVNLDSLPKINLGPMAGGEQTISYFFNNLFPILGDQPIKPGESWTSMNEEGDNENSMIKTETTSHLVGLDQESDTGWLKIETRSAGIVSRSNQSMGMDVHFEADVESDAVWYFDYLQGKLTKLTSENVVEGTVAMSGQMTQTLPMIIEGKSTTALLTD